MFEVTILSTVVYSLALLMICYLFFCWQIEEIIQPEFRKIVYYISLFSLFGVIGEAFTNTIYEYVFGSPLWEYHLYPAHGGDITYFFIFVWGTLGVYTYFRNRVFRSKEDCTSVSSGLILGCEAVFIELMVNVPFFFLFGSYIFYYLPATLGPLSHFSTLHVIPFYMIVGYVTGKLIAQQERMEYRHLHATTSLYWMIIITFVFL